MALQRGPATELDYLRATQAFDAAYGMLDPETVYGTLLQQIPQLFMGSFCRIAEIVNPVDPLLARSQHDPDHVRLTVAFGGITGVVLAQEGYYPEFSEVAEMFAQPLVIEDPPDAVSEQEKAAHAAKAFLQLGDTAVAACGGAVWDWFSDTADRYIPNPELHRYFRVGAGAVLAAAKLSFEAKLQQELRQFGEEVQKGGIDWNQLLPPPSP